jgi:methyl-accepting chemotaxis protein
MNKNKKTKEVDVLEYFRVRTKKMSLVFVSILVGVLVILIPVLFFVVKSTIPGIAALGSMLVSLLSFNLIRINRIKIGNAIFLSILMLALTIALIGGVLDPPSFTAILVTVLGFSIGIIVPSGLLVNSGFTIAMGVYYSIAYPILIYLSGIETLLIRIPLFLLVLWMGVAIIFYVTRLQNVLLKKSMEETKKSSKSLAEVKDIISKISTLRDEVETSQKSVSQQLNDISELISNFSQKIDTLVESSTEFSNVIKTNQDNLNLLVDEIANITNKIDNQSALISQNSSGQEEVFRSIQSISTNVKNANEINTTLSKRADTGKEDITGARESMKDLGEYQQQMISIISVISNLSQQTNLLAMNANIEAAHAGEAGRGFGVVADEIRKLADESGIKTKQISDIIKSMNAKIDQSVSLVENVSNSLLEITEKVEESYPIISEISVSMDELMISNKEMLKSNEELVSNAQSIKESADNELSVSDEYKTTFKRLKEYFEELSSIVGSLKDYNTQSLSILQNISKIREENETVNQNIEELLQKYKEDDKSKSLPSKEEQSSPIKTGSESKGQ